MSLSKNIKQVISMLNKVIGQTPLDKQPLLTQKVNKVITKYKHQGSQDNQAPFLKQLEFNLNFIRLSFPHLDYSPPAEQNKTQSLDQEDEILSDRVQEQFFELENKEQVLKFVEQTQKSLKGVRQEVEFSNWGTGNLDPEDLKRHKQLIKRQYFGGDFWKDKEKPMSPSASFLMNMMQNQPQKREQKIIVKDSQSNMDQAQDIDDRWQKVKR